AGTFNANPMTLVAGEVVMRALTPAIYRRLAELGEHLRQRLRTALAETGVPAQVTGVASLFGIHFTPRPIRDYRDVVASDQELKRAVFIGLLNEGILVQTGCAGALGVMTTEREVDTLVDALQRVLPRVR
ncbi:MAG: aspartate aminotransferase family protein, partial [Candidatus Rokuibacteriota bacterium]